MIFWPVPAL